MSNRRRIKEKKQGEAMRNFAFEHCHECALCNKPAIYVGVFVPTDQKAFGVPPGRTRSFVYGLCAEHCRDLDESMKAVEEKAQKWIAGAFIYESHHLRKDGTMSPIVHSRAPQPGAN